MDAIESIVLMPPARGQLKNEAAFYCGLVFCRAMMPTFITQISPWQQFY
ncbi:hypothetical protein ABENE_21440 [Asticcacaulis benevestitus DSM 16100 = ATCC BAA-896]|uniref:Uncharacterized protein n=1 Tax=Asticcacaulis benevestitus DSM 16100 = ATCC BAA-896 TaxID=1121022 RepID=V4P0Y7_9CAUL|nr:hypothetical protein ABENE_21440 [Asticcacaulis benevestitus DSM 16100 = ATCC BAA-896]